MTVFSQLLMEAKMNIPRQELDFIRRETRDSPTFFSIRVSNRFVFFYCLFLRYGSWNRV